MPGRGRGRGKGRVLNESEVQSTIGSMSQLRVSEPQWAQKDERQYEDPIEQDIISSVKGSGGSSSGSGSTDADEIFSISTSGSSLELQRKMVMAQSQLKLLKFSDVDEGTKERTGRKKIQLRSNYFNITIKLKNLYQYRIEWGPADQYAPLFKSKEDRHEAFQSFVEQYISSPELNQTGFDKTLKRPSTAPSYDGENLVFYHHAFEEMDFWKENRQKGNWNVAIQNLLTNWEAFTKRNMGIDKQAIWEIEMKKKNNSMFPNKDKAREFALLSVNHKPPNFHNSFKYTMLLTRTLVISAKEINDCATGEKHSQAALQAIDVIFRTAATSRSFTRIKRTIYSTDPSNKIEPHPKAGCKGKYIWIGCHQSVRPTKWKSFALNIDQHAAMFYHEQDIFDFIQNMGGGDRRNFDIYDHRNKSMAERQLKGLMFTPQTNQGRNAQYKINGLGDGANVAKFSMRKDGMETTVADYFQGLGMKLSHPRLPCVRVGTPKSKKMMLFPMELCKLAPNQVVKGANPSDVSALIKETAKDAPTTKRNVEGLAKTMTSEMTDFLEDYGIHMDGHKMAKTNADILEAPGLEGQRLGIKPRAGNFRLEKVKDSKPVGNWIIAKVRATRDIEEKQFRLFVRNMCEQANSMNIDLLPGELMIDRAFDFDDADEFFNLCVSEKVNLAIIILPGRDSDLYSWVKKLAELEHGVMTQCIQWKTFVGNERNGRPFDKMTASNLLMKINHKLDGTNVRVQKSDMIHIFEKPVLVISASLSHSVVGGPTVAAMTGSIDSCGARYCAFASLQSKTHLIQEMRALAYKCLKGFYMATNNKKPEAIIYYRDGLGEGQFEEALKYEVSELREACKMYDEDYSPGITMLSVQRRHHTKFYVENDYEGEGKAKNIPAGTVIEHGPTSNQFYDFYLCSHAGIQGTSKASHYMVMHDDNKLSAPALQNMTYALCHAYARCTRTVSAPIGVCYAKLMAERGRYWLRQCGFNDDTMSLGSGKSGDSDKLNTARSAIENAHKKLAYRMFFT